LKMDLRDKLRQQLALQKQNQQKLEQAGKKPAATPNLNGELGGSAASIQRQLERLRQMQEKKCSPPVTPAESQQQLALSEGVVKQTRSGTFLSVEVLAEAPSLGALDPVGKIRPVLSLMDLLFKTRFSCTPEQVVFLDTETTGLSGGTGTVAFLVGLGRWSAQGFQLEQFFMRTFQEEGAMLEALAERLRDVRLLVTFNGKGFDVPLLESRFVLQRQRWPMPAVAHLDLLYPARRLWKLRLQDCSLGNLEKQLLGVERAGDVPGHLIPHLYFNYLQTGIPRGMAEILRHNRQDICSLAALTERAAQILLADKPAPELHAAELFSTGRYFRALGRRQQSMEFHQAALSGNLGQELEIKALFQLAEMHKAQGEYPQAVEFWESILRREIWVEEVFEALAIYYEHHAKNITKALELTQSAMEKVAATPSQLARWEKRRSRLGRKLADGRKAK
jgi:uncharacterized protein